MARELKRWGENILTQGAPRLAYALNVFTMRKIAARAIRCPRPCATTTRQPAITQISSTSRQFCIGRLKFAEENAARPINRKTIAMRNASQRKWGAERIIFEEIRAEVNIPQGGEGVGRWRKCC